MTRMDGVKPRLFKFSSSRALRKTAQVSGSALRDDSPEVERLKGQLALQEGETVL